MKKRPRTALPRLERQVLPGMHVTTLTRASHGELFITAVPVAGRSPRRMLRDVADLLRDHRAGIVSLDVFGDGGWCDDSAPEDPSGTESRRCERMLSEAFGRVAWPVTWLKSERPGGSELGGVQVWALSGVEVEPLELADRVVGSVFETGGARYCRLGGLLSADSVQPRAEQARDVLEQMEAALQAAVLDFGDVLRTWFLNDEILSWYTDFNQVRDAFFERRRVFDGVVPASTGIGGRNAAGVALLGGLLAVRGGPEGPRVTAATSPLQCPALEYGSSFSRAVELATSDFRQLFVSGTASITPGGETMHIGDVDRQFARTLDVVQAILNARGMAWPDVTRGVAYFRRAEDAPAFHRYCADRGLAPLPVVCAQSTICRDELLFELEVDAAVITRVIKRSGIGRVSC